MIVFKNVSKNFTSLRSAIASVSFEIKDKEFVFFVGSSGAGKTTLLRLIMRDLRPSEGEIWVDKENVNKLPDNKIYLLRRKVGMVFQDFKLLIDRTVFENVSIGLEILGKKPAEITNEVLDTLALVGLKDKKLFFPVQLSAGEMQRVSIARAIISGPKILLADEPTGNLDPQTGGEIVDILQEINKLGTTVIMATHNTQIVNELKKRIIHLEGGRIVSDDENGHYPTRRKK